MPLANESSSAHPTVTSPGRAWTWMVVAILAILAVLIYHPVRTFEFLNFDDDLYVETNPWLKKGFTAALQTRMSIRPQCLIVASTSA